MVGNKIPDSAKECITTLLPKTNEEREKLGNWRPTTIGNILMRLYAKISDNRLRANLKLDGRQKGFAHVDRCFQNVKILQQIIKQQRKCKKEYNIVFLDLAKAFDTVSHKSITNGMTRKGIPEEVIDGILEMYKLSVTIINNRGKTTTKININLGVKQGCPLAPLLFNIIKDKLISKLKNRDIGIKVAGQSIVVMAFAHDLVLVMEDLSYDNSLDECLKFFNKGLKVNAGKCGSMRMLPVNEKKSMKVVTDTHRYWNEVPKPTLNFEKFSKYLRVFIKYDGEVALPISEWKTQLGSLRKSSYLLQKVQVIRQVVHAKILYQIRLSDHGLGMAQKLDKLLQNEIKQILHLPS